MQNPATRHQLKVILTVSFFYMAIAAVSIVTTRNLEFMLYLATMSLMLAAVLAVYRRAGLSVTLLWGFSLWGLMHMVGGLAPIPDDWHAPDVSGVVYNWRLIPGFLKYDQVVHGIGVGLVTWLVWQALATRVRSSEGGPLQPTGAMLAVCATAGMGFGAFNEAVEFIASLILPENNIGGYHNTGWDLVSNFVGATVAATIIFLVSRQRRRRLVASISDYGA